VSVGNLSVGGRARPLRSFAGRVADGRGLKSDFSSRVALGAKRRLALVDPAGSSRDLGDEPLLLARRLAVPVIVGEDAPGCVFAEKKFGLNSTCSTTVSSTDHSPHDFDIGADTLKTSRSSASRRTTSGALTSLRRADAVCLSAARRRTLCP